MRTLEKGKYLKYVFEINQHASNFASQVVNLLQCIKCFIIDEVEPKHKRSYCHV